MTVIIKWSTHVKQVNNWKAYVTFRQIEHWTSFLQETIIFRTRFPPKDANDDAVFSSEDEDDEDTSILTEETESMTDLSILAEETESLADMSILDGEAEPFADPLELIEETASSVETVEP